MHTLPVLQPDLRHEETIIQAANSIFQLQSVICAVFDQIDSRIHKNNLKINAINQRLDVVNERGQKLVGLRHATKMLSPSEYTESQCPDVPMTSGGMPSPSPQLENYTVESKLDPVGNRLATEKLLFFNVNNNVDECRRLYWNGTSSAQQSRSIVNSVDKQSKIRSGHVYTENHFKSRDLVYDRLGAAPPSISNRKMHLIKRQSDIAFYSPSKHDVPEIELPLDLPDLPGIADNVLVYSSSTTHPITTGRMLLSDNSVPELPDLNLGPNGFTAVDKANQFLNETSKTVVDNPSVSAQIPPPPPPPPPPVAKAMGVTSNINLTLEPPPPPIVTTMQSLPPKENDECPDQRSNLMESIRKAGGKSTLRSSEVYRTNTFNQ